MSRFVGHGERRAQWLRRGIMDTASFHWSGDQPTLDHLMADVIQRRMGGSRVERSCLKALGRWERFTRCSGDDRHGLTSRSTRAEIDDLVAYLESV